MKFFGLLFPVLLSLMLFSSAYSQNPGDTMFTGIKVHTFNIKFTDPAYWDSLTAYYDAGNEQYFMATVVYDGVQYDSVGVRFKGNSSYTHPNNKKSMKLAFDEYKTDQRIESMKSVNLNNCWGDPTFMREKLHLDFCRDAGISAPRAGFANVYINDTLFAFYSLVESVDKVFLKTRYGTSKGDYFKAIDGYDTSTIVSDFRWWGTDTNSYQNYYELKSDGSATAWPRLVTLLDSLNFGINPLTSYTKVMNLSTFYKAFAVDNLFANLDSYMCSGRNFYFFYDNTSTRWNWIVWDASLSIGAYQGGISTLEALDVNYIIDTTTRPLLTRLYASDTLKKQYLYTYDTLLTKYFVPATMYAHIDSIANVIRSYVNADPRKMYTLLQFETNITSDISATGGLGTRKPGLKSFISKRKTNVATQMNNLGINITAVENENAKDVSYKLLQNYPNPCNPSTKISFTIPIESHVKLDVYNVTGEKVASLVNSTLTAGTHEINFNVANLTSGVYFYKIAAGDFVNIKKMIVLK